MVGLLLLSAGVRGSAPTALAGLEKDGATRSPVPMEPMPEAVLLVSGHTAGWITPCGCPGVRAGGVARRAGYGQLLRKTFPGVPVRYLDLGGVLTLKSESQRATTDAVLDSMDRIGYEGMNVAVGDLGSSLKESEYIQSHIRVPRFSANIVYHDTGGLAFPPYKILTLSRQGFEGSEPLRIGVLGLVMEWPEVFAFGPSGRSLITAPMEQALAKYLPELRAKVDLVLVFAETPPNPLYPLLKRFPGIDLVLFGVGNEVLKEPQLAEGVPILAVGTQGKYLAELRIYRKEGRPAIRTFVHWLDTSFPEDPDLARHTEETLDRLNEVSRLDLERDTATPPSSAPFVGVARCEPCHQREVEIWKGSKHASALDTLVKLRREYTAVCVLCHVTGFNAAEGGGFFSPHATPHLTHVQCEACHGPAEAHLKEPSAPFGKVPEAQCASCHTPEQDPQFDREERWKPIAH